MKRSALWLTCIVLPGALAAALFACGSDGGGGASATNDASTGNDATTGGGDATTGGNDGSTLPIDGGGNPKTDGGTSPSDAGALSDADSPADASDPVDGSVFDAGSDSGGGAVDAGPPGYQYVGRFDTSDAAGPRMAWPGTRIVARFDGTDVSVKLSQVNGFGGGPSWFNVIVDGVVQTPFSATGASVTYPLAAGLGAGVHTIELEKRTEANLGTVRFEGMTFAGGAGLLAPPPAATRTIEFLSDSTIDGFGVEGDRNVTCVGNAPPQYNNARKSMSFLAAAGLNADMVLSAYSGKGIQVNQSAGDKDTFPIIFPRTLPEANGSVWNFANITPDAVVISLGGTDMDNLAVAPAGFQTAFNNFVGTVRGKYPNAYVWLLLWSQIKNDNVAERTAMKGVLDAIVAGRKAGGDDKIYDYVFPQADVNNDETGCFYHANATHHQNMANLMITEIKARTGW